MKELYVHHNKLELVSAEFEGCMSQQRICICRTLEGSILSFKFLSTLVVSHNRLAGLDNVLDCLKKLPFLKHLGKTYLHLFLESPAQSSVSCLPHRASRQPLCTRAGL